MPDPLSPTELQAILNFTTELARKAGALMLEGSHEIQRAGASSVGEKKNAVDLVTEYDVKVEELVRSEIAQAYPHFQFIGEESYSSGIRTPLTDTPTFCVDPIGSGRDTGHALLCRRHNELCARLPLRVHLPRPNRPACARPRHDLQPAPRAPLHRCARRRRRRPTPTTAIRKARARARLLLLLLLLLPVLPPPPQRLPLGPARPRPALVAVEWGSDRAQDSIRRKADSFSRLAGAPPHGIMAH